MKGGIGKGLGPGKGSAKGGGKGGVYGKGSTQVFEIVDQLRKYWKYNVEQRRWILLTSGCKLQFFS